MNVYTNPEIWKGSKILRHASIINNIPIPINVEIELARVCNYKCVFCFNHGKPNNILMIDRDTGCNDFFPSDRLYKLIDELHEVGCKSISFTGSGEPLLHKDIFKIIDKVIEYKMDVGITTNLSKKLTDKQIDILNKVSWIRCSFNASSKELYNIIHKPYNKKVYDIVIDNIYRLIEHKQTLLNLSFVICKENEHDVKSMYELAKKLEVDSLSFRPYVEFERSNVEYNDEVKETLIDIYKNKDIPIDTGINKLYDTTTIEEDIKCYMNRYALFITSNGDILPCCITQSNRKYIYSNILNQSFVDFWNSDLQRNHYKDINMRYCPLCKRTKDNQLLKLIYNEDGLVNNFV